MCKTCADIDSQDECQCSEEKHAIIGTWCTPELTKAIEVGYMVIVVFEVHHWDTITQNTLMCF